MAASPGQPPAEKASAAASRAASADSHWPQQLMRQGQPPLSSSQGVMVTAPLVTVG